MTPSLHKHHIPTGESSMQETENDGISQKEAERDELDQVEVESTVLTKEWIRKQKMSIPRCPQQGLLALLPA